ncbi:MAG: alpha/beta hydrolase [Phototrophicales bacterium]|nr:MAG: alpha/beta hydrolase [Phototrophicales bacterium]
MPTWYNHSGNGDEDVMPRIKTAHGEIYFTDHRKSERIPVIFVHGAGGSHLDWGASLRRLPEANAIALDLPGHGKSPAPGRSSIPDYAADVIGLIDTLNVPQAIIAGHSMGGAIAQTIALTYPQRVHGLILIGTAGKLVVNPYIIEKSQSDQDELAQTLVKWMWGKNATDDMRLFSYQQLMRVSPQVLHDDYIACNHFDIRDKLSDIHMPTLVIGGSADKMTPIKFSEYLAEHIPQAQLVVIPDGGHMMMLEQPEIVTQAVKDWLCHAAT